MLQGSKDCLNCVIYSVLRRKAGLIKKENITVGGMEGGEKRGRKRVREKTVLCEAWRLQPRYR